MFSRYYAGRSTSTDYVQRYRESPHKVRLDHVARALVALRYREAVIAQHLREWLRLTIDFDARGLALPASVRAPEVQAYLAQRETADTAKGSLRSFAPVLDPTEDRQGPRPHDPAVAAAAGG